MPLIEKPYLTPYLVYDAPVNEKTKKIREMFKVDEKTGYPEHYNWRALSRLGPDYQPQDPFKKFDPYDPNDYISTKVTYVILSTAAIGLAHYIHSIIRRTPFWVKGHHFVGGSAALSAFSLWVHHKTLERQSLKHAIMIDYMEKHRERFGPIHRPKIREVLAVYVPIR